MSQPEVSINRQILAVAVPAFAALVAEPLMLLADTAIVGHLGTPELAGLAVAAVVLGTAVGLCVFLAYGTTAAVARSHGAGRAAAAFSQAVGGVWLALGLGVILAAAIAATARPVTRWLASSATVADHAHEYLLISTLGIPAALVMLAATGALRGVLDLRTPLIVTAAACLINVILNVWFVYGLDWGIAGAAIGTVVTQWGAAVWLSLVVARNTRTAGAGLRPELGPVVQAARDGVPLLVRTATLRASLLLATAVAGTFGDAPLAAHQIAGNVVIFTAFALDAIAIAGQTLTGHSLGAADAGRTRELTRVMLRWGWGFGAAIGLILAALSPWLPSLFTSDQQVIDALIPVLLVVAALQPLSGAVFVLDGILIGAGDGRYLAVAGTLVLLAYAPLAWLVEVTDLGLTWLWVAYGAFIAARWITLEWRQRGDRWMVLG